MRYSILIALIALAASLSGQQSFGEIHGKVYDEFGAPMPYAEVYVQAGEKMIGGITDDRGKYKIKPVDAGTYIVKCSFMGYYDVEKHNVVVKPNKITFVSDINLELKSELITGGARIEVEKFKLVDVDLPTLKTITAEELKHSPMAKNLAGAIELLSSEIKKDPNSNDFYVRGSRLGSNIYYVDGVKIMGSTPRIPGSGIGSISVFTGGVPAKYGDATGGYIIIETKNYFDLYNKKKYGQTN